MSSGLKQFKESAASLGRDLATELALEFYREDILAKISKFFKPYSPEDVATHIQERNPILPPESLITWLRGFSAQLSHYSVEDMSIMLLGWIGEVRSDLGNVLVVSGDAGALWLVGEAKLIRDATLGAVPETINEPEKKIEFTRADCEKCHKVWLVSKEEAEHITRCPFCGQEQGVSREKTEGEE